MEKITSYYDWELQFRSKAKQASNLQKKRTELNSLGMPVDEFRSFLKKWESKSLS